MRAATTSRVRRYVSSGWFFLDLLAGFPVLLVVKLANQGSEAAQGQSLLQLQKTTKIFRIFRVLRVFRLVKLNRLFSLLEDQLKLSPATLVWLLKMPILAAAQLATTASSEGDARL